tara:strand:+ start:876 stop:1439 length:564 start_codon:yes stop_codon:yes gene_type:complete
MELQRIINTGHLYIASNIFPQWLVDQVNTVDWLSAAYDRVEIGNFKRRSLIYNPARDDEFDKYARDVIAPQIERECGITFTDTQYHSFNLWIDEPGFKPRMHTDGDLHSALQIYWLPSDRTDLGTAFYSTNQIQDLTHYFPNIPNTGYLMLNSHEPRPKMWHDMEQKVPEGVLRLCLYITFGPYTCL